MANQDKAMDADSWSARLSSASRSYKSALQSRSGKLFAQMNSGLSFFSIYVYGFL